MEALTDSHGTGVEGDRQDIAGASLWKSVVGAHLRVSSGNRAFQQWSNSRGQADRVWSESEAKMSWCVVLASEIFEARDGPGRVGGAFELRFAESPALGVTVYLLFEARFRYRRVRPAEFRGRGRVS